MNELRLGVDASALRQLKQCFAAAPEMTAREMRGFMIDQVAHLKADAQERTPTMSGNLRKSIIGNVMSLENGLGVKGVVGSTALHAGAVEMGSRPHWAPLEPLIDWVLAKIPLGQYSSIKTHRAGEKRKADRWVEAAVIARSIQLHIAHYGTPAAGMFHGAWNSNRDQIREQFSQTVRRIAAQIGATA